MLTIFMSTDMGCKSEGWIVCACDQFGYAFCKDYHVVSVNIMP